MALAEIILRHPSIGTHSCCVPCLQCPCHNPSHVPPVGADPALPWDGLWVTGPVNGQCWCHSQGQPGWTLPAPCFSLASCLASAAAAVLGPGHSHHPSHSFLIVVFLLGILWVPVCVFQRMKSRHRSQLPCGQEPSAPRQQALQSSNDLPAGRLEKLFSSKFQKI